jgi:mannose-6-phosphate isomerase-like protein (cupin superfamily)
MLRSLALLLGALALGLTILAPGAAGAQAPTSSQGWERIWTLGQLPDGPLYWRLQTFATRDAAEVAAGPTGQVGEAEGQVWLFTLGRQDEPPVSGVTVAQIGPLEVPNAAEYELRITYRTTPPGGAIGAATGAAVHFHPGAETFYLLAGEQTVWTPGRQARTEAGQSWTGEPAGTPMVLINTGATERRAFTLYVGDAAQPWVIPTVFQ